MKTYAPFLPTPPLWPPKREYNAVPAITGEIWQYRTGGKLTIFNKDHDTAEIAKVLVAKYTASLQLLRTVGGNQARLDARTEFENPQRQEEAHGCIPPSYRLIYP